MEIIMDKNKILGGLYGLLIGDAMGVPYEFHKKADLEKLEYIDFEPPEGFDRAHKGVKPGTYSDDGAQALCLLDSLLECGKFDLKNFSDKLLNWFDNGFWAVNNVVFDVGIQTADSLNAYRSGVSCELAGFTNENGKGNGSLMRVLPLALWHRGEDEELVNNAQKQSLITHGNPCNQVCCALYCLWVRNILKEIEPLEAYYEAANFLKSFYKEDSEHYKEFEWTLIPFEEIKGTGSGYVVDSIRSARDLMQKNNFTDVIKGAILLGNDTDTTAAIAGGLAGVHFGYDNIPAEWIDKLLGMDEVKKLFNDIR